MLVACAGDGGSAPAGQVGQLFLDGVHLTRLGLSRRTRLAHRAGAEDHPAVRAVAEAFGLAAKTEPAHSPR